MKIIHTHTHIIYVSCRMEWLSKTYGISELRLHVKMILYPPTLSNKKRLRSQQILAIKPIHHLPFHDTCHVRSTY